MTPKLLDDEDHNQILGNNMRGLVQIFAMAAEALPILKKVAAVIGCLKIVYWRWLGQLPN